jgi:hypothetical protein
MNTRLKKILLLVVASALLTGAGFVQHSLNGDRKALGLTRVEPLENAPPVLAFTTVALGGFRGLISNALWIRANDLQDEDKFFEMAQLADWITKLEPHFVHVWLVQGWNMAYNISVKFKETAPGQFPDRWRWVKRGIELLRDEGLRYNPNEVLIYRELAWFFQHKMGANLDDANMYYKQQWANEMARVFEKKKPDLAELIHPVTQDQTNRARLLRETYKMDPEFMAKVDEQYGPLEWRLPEAHAIYWAAEGLRHAALHPEKVKTDDLITLRRVIYQSMQMSFHRGRLVINPFAERFEFGPNLDIIPKVSTAYEQAAEEDKNNREHILRAHRNFLRDAIYFLYSNNRVQDAAYWFKYIGTQYPDKTLLDGTTNTYPGQITLDEYVVARVQEDVRETDKNRVQAIIEGYIVNAYTSLALGEDERSAGHFLMARKIWETYMSQIPEDRRPAIGLPPFDDINQVIRGRMLDPTEGLPFEARAIVREKLGLAAEPPPAATPAPASGQTNAPTERPAAG